MMRKKSLVRARDPKDNEHLLQSIKRAGDGKFCRKKEVGFGRNSKADRVQWSSTKRMDELGVRGQFSPESCLGGSMNGGT